MPYHTHGNTIQHIAYGRKCDPCLYVRGKLFKGKTQQAMKNTEPNRELTCKLTSESLVPPAEMAANTSGAPLPNASRVTPAILFVGLCPRWIR